MDNRSFSVEVKFPQNVADWGCRSIGEFCHQIGVSHNCTFIQFSSEPEGPTDRAFNFYCVRCERYLLAPLPGTKVDKCRDELSRWAEQREKRSAAKTVWQCCTDLNKAASKLSEVMDKYQGIISATAAIAVQRTCHRIENMKRKLTDLQRHEERSRRGHRHHQND